MRELKKSLLITLDFPPRLGGVAAYYLNVCDNLPPDKIVVLAPDHPQADTYDAHLNFPVIRSRALKKLIPSESKGFKRVTSKINWISLNREIKAIIRSHQVELLQIGQILPLGLLGRHYKKQLRVPYVFYSHGMDILIPQSNSRKKIQLKRIIKSAKGIVANSYFTADELIKLGADPDIIAVANPCPNTSGVHVPDQQLSDFLYRKGLDDRQIILSVGRLVQRKGHDKMIEAMAMIVKQYPKAFYAIVGEGPRRKKLQELINKYRLGHHAKIYGAVPAEDLPFFYQTCDIFAMPSRRLPNGDVEGFGIVYLEANQYGKPVIGGRSGGVREAVIDGQTGLLVDPNNEVELAEATMRLLGDPAYAHRLGLQGLDRVLEEFTWDNQVSKILPLLKY